MVDVSNIKQVFVLKDCDRTANVQITDPHSVTTYLGNGESVVTDPQGNVLTTTTAIKAVDRVFITTRSLAGDDVYRSVEIPGKAITGFHCANYAAASEQSSVIGYNGASGALGVDLAADTLYWVKVISEYTPGCRNVESFAFKSGFATPTEADVVLGIASKINLKGGVKGYDDTLKIKATVLSDVTPVAIIATGAVTFGSKFVKLSAATTSIVDGDVVTIDTVPYQVDSVLSTTQIKLTMPFQGLSVTAGALAELPKTGNWGLKIEGLPYEFEAGKWNYNICKFELAVSENISSKFATTASDRGVGTYKQVADMEWHCKGLISGQQVVGEKFPVNPKYDAPLSVDGENETFDLVTVTWENKETQTIHGNTVQSGSVVLAIPTGAGQGDGGTDTIAEVLNKYIVTENGIGSAITLT